MLRSLGKMLEGVKVMCLFSTHYLVVTFELELDLPFYERVAFSDLLWGLLPFVCFVRWGLFIFVEELYIGFGC